MTSYSRKLKPWLLAQVFLAVAVFHGIAWPQDSAMPDIGQISSLEELLHWSQTEKGKAELRSDLDELKKPELLGAYDEARSALESAQAYREKELGYQKIIEVGQDKVQSMKKSIKDLEDSGTAVPGIPKSMSLPDAEQQLIKMQSEHAALESRLIEIQNILDELKTRPAKVRGQVAEARKVLLTLGNQLAFMIIFFIG